jgi:iron-siderophore transport system permease protein
MSTLTAARPAAARPTARPRTLVLGLVGLLVALALVAVLSVVVGARSVGLGVVLDALRHYEPADATHQIVANRLARLVAGLVVGAGLGLAGVLLQGITRNPLADPGLLGINAGSAMALVCAIAVLGISAPLGYVWFAFGGALVVAVLVYAIGSLGRDGATPVKLALAGAAVGAVLTSLTTAILLTDAATFDRYRFWTVGSLAGRRMDLVAQLAPFIVAGVVLALCTGRLLNTLSLGDDVARGLGMRVGTARVAAGAVAVVLCGAATAIAGPLWFLGLLVPHLARLLVGPDHRWVLPYALLLGPTLLLLADVLGRVIAPPGELQVGVVLSFLGAPFLIALIRRRRSAEP